MNEDKPFDLPPALTVAEMCVMRAWDDETDDDSRLVLEMAEHTIRALHCRLVKISKSLETIEADAGVMANYIRSMSGQKGGAA
jgi:hypothetical protein